MKRMLILSLYFIATCPFVHAGTNDTNIIYVTFSDQKATKQVLYSSFEKLIDINKQLRAMRALAITSANSINSSAERSELDSSYQSEIIKLEALVKSTNYLELFPTPENKVNIITYTPNNTYAYISLENLDPSSLGIDNLNIESKGNAKAAYHALRRAIITVEQQLPDVQDASDMFALASLTTHQDNEDSHSTLIFKNQLEKQKLLAAIVELRFRLIEELKKLESIAMSAMEVSSDLEALKMEFAQRTNNLFKVNYFNLLRANDLYKNSELEVIHNKSTHYQFPKIYLSHFKLLTSHIYDQDEAMIVINNIDKMSDYIANILLQD